MPYVASLNLTVDDVLKLARKDRMKVTRREAEDWLKRYGKPLVSDYRKPLLQKAAAFIDIDPPEQALAKVMRDIEQAFDDAVDEYAKRKGKDFVPHSYASLDFRRVARRLMKGHRYGTARVGIAVETGDFELTLPCRFEKSEASVTARLIEAE